MILVELFYRGVSYFVLPFLGQGIVDGDGNPIFLLIMIFVCFIVLVFLKWLDYDFTRLRREFLDTGFQKSLTKINWAMGAYYLVMQSLSYLEYEQGIQSTTVRHLILVFYLLFLWGYQEIGYLFEGKTSGGTEPRADLALQRYGTL